MNIPYLQIDFFIELNNTSLLEGKFEIIRYFIKIVINF